MLPDLPSKYRQGDTDALLRQNRAYLRLIDDDEIPTSRKRHLTAVITQNFRELDHWLSTGRPLPIEWRRRIGEEERDVPESVPEATERPTRGAAGTGVTTKEGQQ